MQFVGHYQIVVLEEDAQAAFDTTFSVGLAYVVHARLVVGKHRSTVLFQTTSSAVHPLHPVVCCVACSGVSLLLSTTFTFQRSFKDNDTFNCLVGTCHLAIFYIVDIIFANSIPTR